MEKHFANDLTDKTNQVLVVSSDESEITVINNIQKVGDVSRSLK